MSIETENGPTFPRFPLTAEAGRVFKDRPTRKETDLYEGLKDKQSQLCLTETSPLTDHLCLLLMDISERIYPEYKSLFW